MTLLQSLRRPVLRAYVSMTMRRTQRQMIALTEAYNTLADNASMVEQAMLKFDAAFWACMTPAQRRRAARRMMREEVADRRAGCR